MSSRLFLRIVNDIESRSKYFQQTQDARGKLGFLALQKCTSAIRQLALGSIPDSQDEYLQMSKRVSRDSLNKFWSIDCTHWPWVSFPTRWRVSGANNDLNVLHQSSLLNDIKEGIAPECPFEVNNNVYAFGYYLGDGIYPKKATFVKAYKNPGPNDVKQQRFKKAQEAARKDIKRAFDVLERRWNVVNNPARAVKPDNIKT
uniref:Protein ALP1-like n=1 Tax=Tanacetum cinerariifolium TaxID=118510 RepID=A0A699K847_TANCI|nr:hypothetical protein [Tanacetum cinerariifolium]